MALLDGDLATSIYKGFKGKLLTGLIRQRAPLSSGALDSYGDPLEYDTTDTDLEGFTEDYSDAFRATAGIPETDLRVNIFAKSMDGITPAKDDIVKFTRGTATNWYQLRKVATDPAIALWVCQAFEIPEPA